MNELVTLYTILTVCSPFSLPNNQIDDTGASYLAKAIKFCRITLLLYVSFSISCHQLYYLLFFSLYDNKDIGDKGAREIGKALPLSPIQVMS